MNKIKNRGEERGLLKSRLLKHFRYLDIDHNGYLELHFNNYDEKLSDDFYDTDYREDIIDFDDIERDIVEALPDYHKTLFENSEEFKIIDDIKERYNLFGDDLLSYMYFKHYMEHNVFNDNIADELVNYERPRMDGLLLKFMRSQDIKFLGETLSAENIYYLYPSIITTSHRIQ
ncbi:MAG: hypothetical protein ACOCRK_04160 [bacterium]